jgi:hypothetical protein
MFWLNPRRCHGVAEDAVQACPHPSSRKVGSLQAAESLDI